MDSRRAASCAGLIAALVWITGCGGTAEPDGDGGLDAWVSFDAGREDVATARDARHDAPLDAVAAPDTSSPDGGEGATCPVGSDCTLPDGRPGACCDGACVDRTADATNCGRCGLRCREGMGCIQGVCAYASCAGVPEVPSAFDTFPAVCLLADGTPQGVCCGDACHPLTDFDDDPANCGACSLVCGAGDACVGGRCASIAMTCTSASPPCPTGTSCWQRTACIPSTCASAPDGTVCSLSLGRMRLGLCCGGVCADPTNDDHNCGTCGHVCEPGSTCAYYGACYPLPRCSQPGMAGAWCALDGGGMGRCCGADCVDLTRDSSNCGTCGIACRTGTTCMSFDGIAACAAALPDGGLESGNCASNLECPSGTQCDPDLNRCTRADCTGRPDGSACFVHGVGSNATMCCGGACVDPTRSPNCGACGVACRSDVCVQVSSWPARSYVTCLPDDTATPDCSGVVGGCGPEDVCLEEACVPRTCPSINALCATAGGRAGTCQWDVSSGTPVLTCRER